jgi:hypothetical protein
MPLGKGSRVAKAGAAIDDDARREKHPGSLQMDPRRGGVVLLVSHKVCDGWLYLGPLSSPFLTEIE